MHGTIGEPVQCESCGQSSGEDAKFCAACGEAFALACLTCGHGLNVGARFCEQCGTPVIPAAGVAVPAEDDAVRKTVTVLFCDLVGSTAFGESVDAESVRETMGRYFAMGQEAVEAHGGTVAKFIGDGIMATFGIPEVAEDDAERRLQQGWSCNIDSARLPTM